MALWQDAGKNAVTNLSIAVLAFLLSHLIPAFKPLRAALVKAMGERLYVAAYGSLTLLIMVWIGFAYAEAPYVELWEFQEWTRWVPLLGMPVVCIFLVCGLLAANPFSVGYGKNWNPDKPGIVAVTRHPVTWGFTLWALVHIPPNGDARSLLLFGLMAVLGFTGPKSLDAKRRAKMGPEVWDEQAAKTSVFPFVAILKGRTKFSFSDIGYGKITGGFMLYLLFLYFHQDVIGVDPMIID